MRPDLTQRRAADGDVRAQIGNSTVLNSAATRRLPLRMENESLFGRFRTLLSRPESGSESNGAPAHSHTDFETQQQRVARELMNEITEFLIKHHLPIDPDTLAFACNLFAGSDPRLPQIVSRRLREEQPITREWVEELRRKTTGDETRALDELRQRLEHSVAEFGKTTKDARSATSTYQSALQTHVDELAEGATTGAMIHELTEVARAMIDRTQEIEQHMARSERETRSLQRRLDEARRNAEMDHLTGLPNRRAFESLLAHEYEDARRDGDALCVAFCDIDKFKAINDEHGHDAGDRVLRLVARTLAEISNDRCHVARHGGEEFVVLFRGKKLAQAFSKLDATREGLAARRLVNRATDTPFGKVSFSAGIADVFAYEDPRAALKAADQALYLAKEQGRDRIVMADPNAPPQSDTKAAA